MRNLGVKVICTIAAVAAFCAAYFVLGGGLGVLCEGKTMRPGDLCDLVKMGTVVDTLTYDQMRERNRSGDLFATAIAAVVAGGAIAWIWSPRGLDAADDAAKRWEARAGISRRTVQ